MYVLDTSAFYILANYYPSRFPTIWDRIDQLVLKGKLWSVREVLRELEKNCPSPDIYNWFQAHRQVFKKPTTQELEVVSQIFLRKQFLGLVKHANILKGWPVADPFVVASAKMYNCSVVTQEILKEGGARIPTACIEFDVNCINFKQFLEREKLKY